MNCTLFYHVGKLGISNYSLYEITLYKKYYVSCMIAVSFQKPPTFSLQMKPASSNSDHLRKKSVRPPGTYQSHYTAARCEFTAPNIDFHIVHSNFFLQTDFPGWLCTSTDPNTWRFISLKAAIYPYEILWIGIKSNIFYALVSVFSWPSRISMKESALIIASLSNLSIRGFSLTFSYLWKYYYQNIL